MAKSKFNKQFKTLALADDKQKESNTQVSHPSKKNVEEAKKFVDANEK